MSWRRSGLRRLRFRQDVAVLDPTGETAMTGTVLVLNASYERLQRVSLRQAIKMLVHEVAVVG